jgi:hypothetical protein
VETSVLSCTETASITFSITGNCCPDQHNMGFRKTLLAMCHYRACCQSIHDPYPDLNCWVNKFCLLSSCRAMGRMLGDIPARFTPEPPLIQNSRFDLRALAFRTDSNHSASVLLLLSHSGPPTRRLRSLSVGVRVHFEVALGLYFVTMQYAQS